MANTHWNSYTLYKEKPDYDSKQFLNYMPVSSDPDYVRFVRDFIAPADYSTTDTTLTLVGTGTAATSTSIENGALVLTTTNSSSDSNNLQWKNASFKCASGKPLWFSCKAQVSNVSDVDFMVGLAVLDTTALDAVDRIVFRMSNGAATLNYESVSSGASSSTGATGVSLVAATDATFEFYWDGSSTLRFFVNRQLVKTLQANIPTAALTPTFHIKTNSANARSANIDYVYVQRLR